MPEARKLILKNYFSPGDVACMTAAVFSLHRRWPGRFVTAVDTSCPALWEHNPDVVSLEEMRGQQGVEQLDMQYNLVNQSNQRGCHVLEGYCVDLEERLGVRVPLLCNRPQVYLSHQEKQWVSQVQEMLSRTQRYWVINAGYKNCFTAKHYPFYQEVVDRLQGKVFFVQVGKREHQHTPLRGVLSLIGQTDDRQLIRLIANSDGVLSGLTFVMHLGAALQKPTVTLAGGREPRQWNTYPLGTLFSTVGQLDCCRTEACWKSRTVPLGDGEPGDQSLCASPILTTPPSPRCLALVSPDEVTRAILAYGN